MLKNDALVANIGVGTADNEPSKVRLGFRIFRAHSGVAAAAGALSKTRESKSSVFFPGAARRCARVAALPIAGLRSAQMSLCVCGKIIYFVTQQNAVS